MGIPFNVGQHFRNTAVAKLVNVNAANMPLFPRRVCPFMSPAGYTAPAQAKNILKLNMRLGRLAEETLPKLRNRFLTCVHCAIRGRRTIFKGADFTQQRHHSRHIMPVQRFIKR